MALVMDYITSLTHLYGLVHKDKVIEVYNMQHDENIRVTDVDDIAKNHVNELKENFVELHGDYFVHEAIMEFDDVEQELAKRQGKPFYIPNQHELLKYKSDLYFERTKEYKALKEYVQRNFFKGNAYKAEILCEDIQGRCQHSFSMDDIFGPFKRRDIVFEGEDQVREVMDLVMNLSNNVRLWENNGLTPDELHNRTTQPGSGDSSGSANPDGAAVVNNKIGRNEPCPCGSGKKYKKCCGA